MRQKLLALLLSFVMLLSCMTTAFALDEGNAENTTAVAALYNGEELLGTYDDLNTAFMAATTAFNNDKSSPIEYCVKLLEDTEVALQTSQNLALGIMVSCSFDLDGHSLTILDSSDNSSDSNLMGIWAIACDFLDNACSTIENGKIILAFQDGSNSLMMGTYGLYIQEQGNATVKNIELVSSESNSVDAGLCFYAYQENPSRVQTIENSIINVNGQAISQGSLGSAPENQVTFTVISGSYKNLYSGNSLPDDVATQEGSSTMTTNLPEDVDEGTTVITSENTTAIIVDNGNAYLYDTLQDAITAVENGRGSDGETPATITLLKDTEEEVTIKTNTEFNISKANDNISNTGNFTTEDGYEVKTENGTVSVAPIAVTSVTLSPATLQLTVGGEASLTATVEPSTASQNVTWSSNNEDVATVSNGVVTAVAEGTATITATSVVGEKTAICTVTVTRKSSGGGGGSSTPSYTVSTPSNVENGTVTVSPKSASKGTTVTITVKPDSGYELNDLTVTDKNGDTVALTRKSDTQYTFTMPASKVDIEVTFAEIDTTCDGGKDCPSYHFVDVTVNDWYHEAVDYMVERSLMNGTSATTFAPNTTTTRAMLVSVLYRMENSPAVVSAASFNDVPAGQYYTDAVAWANANGIVTGYSNDSFGPDDTLTREQMAAIIYRYAAYKGYDVSARANLSGYTDAAQISSYAADAMAWINAEDIIGGTSATTLTPAGNATRCQFAAILMRFCENVAK